LVHGHNSSESFRSRCPPATHPLFIPVSDSFCSFDVLMSSSHIVQHLNTTLFVKALLFPLLLLSFPLLSSLFSFVVPGRPLSILFIVVGFREILDACFALNLLRTALNVNVFPDI
jgi:hypothetical protein